MGDWAVFCNKEVRILPQIENAYIGRFEYMAESMPQIKSVSVRDKWMFSWEKKKWI